jgi:hypothetical protein
VVVIVTGSVVNTSLLVKRLIQSDRNQALRDTDGGNTIKTHEGITKFAFILNFSCPPPLPAPLNDR